MLTIKERERKLFKDFDQSGMTVRASELNWNAEKETQMSGMGKQREIQIGRKTNK